MDELHAHVGFKHTTCLNPFHPQYLPSPFHPSSFSQPPLFPPLPSSPPLPLFPLPPLSSILPLHTLSPPTNLCAPSFAWCFISSSLLALYCWMNGSWSREPSSRALARLTIAAESESPECLAFACVWRGYTLNSSYIPTILSTMPVASFPDPVLAWERG